MRLATPVIAASLLAVCAPLLASDAPTAPTPEIERAVGIAQAVGATHTLRTIPEACARLQGRFTGDPSVPYRFAPVRTSPQCQARAQLVDFAAVRPDPANGWVLNDVIRVPQAGCVNHQAVVRVWRKPAVNQPTLDAQGSARIYLEEARQAAAAGQASAPVTRYAAELAIEGQPCP